jgi:hypothetical protein
MSPATMVEALFASALQPSDAPTPDAIRAAILGSLRAHHGVRGCAAICADEYGAHPETAVLRMRWALALVSPPATSTRAA